MASYVCFKEIIEECVTRQFMVTVPSVGEPGFYQQGVSVDAFCNHWKKTRFENPNYTPSYYFISRTQQALDWDVWLWEQTSAKLPGHHLHKLPFLGNDKDMEVVANIWDFYELIDWDHRTKRFMYERGC